MIFKIILLIVLLLLLNIANGFIITDITFPLISKIVSDENGDCQYRFIVLCEPENETEICDIDTVNIESSPTIGINKYELKQDGLKKTFEIILTGKIGSYTVTVETTILPYLECFDLDLNQIQFNMIGNDYYPCPENSDLKFCGDYELVGTNFDYSNVGFANMIFNSYDNNLNNIATLGTIGSNRFYLYLYLSGDINFSSIKANVTFNKVVKEFEFKRLGYDIYDQIYDIKTYPDLTTLTDMQLFGYSENGVVQFTSNNTVFKTGYSLLLSNVRTSAQYFPIYGDSNSTTYLLSLSNIFGSSSLINYNIYNVNNNQISSSSTPSLAVSTFYNQYNYIKPDMSISQVSKIMDSVVILETRFTNATVISFEDLKILNNDRTVLDLSFPYGFINDDNFLINGILFEASYLFKQDNKNGYNSIVIRSGNGNNINSFSLTNINPFDYNSTYLPSAYKVEAIKLVGDTYLFKISIKAPYQLDYIYTDSNIYYANESLVSGNTYDGTYEILAYSISNDNSFWVSFYDIYGGNGILNDNTLLSIDPVRYYPNPTKTGQISVQNTYFLYNNMDVRDYQRYNVFYFNLSNESNQESISIGMKPINQDDLDPTSNQIYSSKFYATWNQSIQLFQIEFYIEANTPVGEYHFKLYNYKSTIPSSTFDSKLIIKDSKLDLQGPMFKSINKILPTEINNSNNKFSIFGWSVIIEDSINGFDYGYVIIRGSKDSSIYNISITPNDLKSGDIYLGEYDLLLNISAPCVSQIYSISQVVLYDRVNRKSIFSSFASNKLINKDRIAVLNPFLYYLNDTLINKISLTCSNDNPASTDITPPILVSFDVSYSPDVSLANREFKFAFRAFDSESGIKNHQYPIIYLGTTNNRIIECKSIIESINSTTADYSCSVQLPYLFGYPDGITISVYGFINNNGLLNGYSTKKLREKDFEYYITTEAQFTLPTITDYVRFNEMGGDLFLYGKYLGDSIKSNLTFSDGSTTVNTLTAISSTTIVIHNVKPTKQPFKVYIITPTQTSNTITINPTIFDLKLPIYTSPTKSPLPTNSPQLCPGNPVCGGPSNGKCISNQGCVCYSPWIGLDCLSQVIIVDQPNKNETSPSTNITLPVNDNSSKTVTYKSLISLVSIREINILGSVVYNTSFVKWEVRELDNTTFIYNTTLEINKSNQKSTTDFKVTLKWFINETTITFANEQLIMNPSTMKYTIEISNYPFENKLNQLQLIMSASIKSDSSDNICSFREYGETASGDNSNYLKIQVENHSLYGRFIRRGIVDSTTTSISNILLDKDMNSISTTKELQSFVGIQIPNYKQSVIIDPDFSIILDSNSASSKLGSICSNESKLSGSKIAGIVIGCVAFITIIIISISYHIIKKKKNTKFFKNVNQKMKQMNNDQL